MVPFAGISRNAPESGNYNLKNINSYAGQAHRISISGYRADCMKKKKKNVPESGTYVMVLQDSSIVVQQGSLGAGHHVEIVRGAGVLEVVDHGRHQGSEDL
jgi:hypothetical protein